MLDVTSWSKDLAVEIGGHDVINHADRTGLTSGLSRAVVRRGFLPVHDRAGYWPIPRC